MNSTDIVPLRSKAKLLGVSTQRRAAACLLLAASVALLDPVRVATSLPPQITVRTAGLDVRIGGLERYAVEIYRWWSIIAIMAVVISAIEFRPNRFLLRQQPEPGHAVAIALGPVWGSVYALSSHPVNIGHPNYWYHWVREVYRDDSNVVYYYLPQLIHRAFVRLPIAEVFLAWTLIYILLYLIIFHLTQKRLLSIVATSSVLATSNFSYFAGAEEDVYIAYICMLSMTFASMKERWTITAFFCVLACAARPQFILFLPTIALWLTFQFAQGRATFLDICRFAITGAIGVIGYQFFILSARRWMFVDGKLLRNTFANLEQIPVDGFIIRSWSGAYFGHAIWMLPVVPLAAVLAVHLTSTKTWPTNISLPILLGASQIFAAEGSPLLYFEFRYLSYATPFLFVAIWSIVGSYELTASRIALITVALFAPLAFGINDQTRRDEIKKSDVFPLAALDGEIRQLADEQCLTVIGPNGGPKNRLVMAMSMILHRPSVPTAETSLTADPNSLQVAFDADLLGDGEKLAVGPVFFLQPEIDHRRSDNACP